MSLIKSGTSVEQKRKGRQAAFKRCGTPRFLRDLLREKCRIRWHEARQSNFQNTRKLVDSITIEEILREELAELEKDVELQAVFYEELKSEADEWLADQIEEEEKYLIEVGESHAISCPVCQRAALDFAQESNFYSCACGTSFLYPGKSGHLFDALQKRVAEHGQRCDENLLFFVEPYPYGNVDGANVLNAMCDSCDFFVSF